MTQLEGKPKIVIVGAGFAGLAAAKALAGSPAEVTIIDRHNYHLFQPLLYQVATADLSPADIAWPIRSILSRARNVSVVLGDVTGIDRSAREVKVGTQSYAYDSLILATGAQSFYFGKADWEPHAPGLKSITDATELRKRILLAFERAEAAEDEADRRRLLNFVVVGGGPTGVEMAGAIAELARVALASDFRRIDPRDARIVLVEGSDRLLGALPADLSNYAQAALTDLGVEVRTGQLVERIDEGGVVLGGEVIPTATVVWGAGVTVPHVGAWLGVETDRGGRVAVAEDLSLPGHPEIFVIGDAARVDWSDGRTVPGIAPAAKQQGRYVGAVIKARLRGGSVPAFHYRHVGNLATIGRHRAVVDLGAVKLKGWLAWWFWGLIHIYFLIEVRSAALVLLQWFWTYLTRHKGARLITEPDAERPKR